MFGIIIIFIVIFSIFLYTRHKNENTETEETDIFNSSQIIVPVDKGEYELFQQQHKYLQNINLNDVLNFARTSTEKNCKDIFIDYIKKDVEQSYSKSEISSASKKLFTLFQLSFDEKNYELAYNSLLTYIYLSINEFLRDHSKRMEIFASLKLYALWKREKPEIPFNQFTYVNQLQEILEKDDEQLRLDFEKVWYNIEIPFHLYTIAECIDIYFWARDGKTEMLKKINSSKEEISLGNSMGRLEEGYYHLENAQKYHAQKNYPDARQAFLKADESFKQANASIERNNVQKLFCNCVKEDPSFDKTLKYLSKIIADNPKIMQSELIKMVEVPPHSIAKDDASSTLYFADKFGLVIRTKKGRSYELTLPEVNTED